MTNARAANTGLRNGVPLPPGEMVITVPYVHKKSGVKHLFLLLFSVCPCDAVLLFFESQERSIHLLFWFLSPAT